MKFSSRILLAALFTLTLPASAPAAANLGNLPLWFQAQVAPTAGQFIAHSREAQLRLTRAGAEFLLQPAGRAPVSVRMDFVGANAHAHIQGETALPGKINYLLGNDRARWQSDLATFSSVRVAQIYSGVDILYYGNQERLEYDFQLAPGIEPGVITIRFTGVNNLRLNAQGELVLQVPGGEIIQHAPIAYQIIAGQRREISAAYQITGSDTVKFSLGEFDRQHALTIDPILGYSTYFGGNYGENALAIAISPIDDSVYLAGHTFSTQFSNNIPFASGGYDTNFNGGTSLFGDVFVAKFDRSGTNLLYCTYLGGNKDEIAYGLAVDASGNAYVAGATSSQDFPVLNPITLGSYNGSNISGVLDVNVGYYPSDAFVTKISADGSSLIYSTLLGGNSYENARAICVDESGNAYFTGETYSTNFPTTDNALSRRLATTNNFYINANAFVAAIPAAGGALSYASYLGGTNFDSGRAIAYNNGRVFVAGRTSSTNFPWTNGLTVSRYLNGFATNATSGSDAFISAFALDGTNLNLIYSTFLGSTNNEVATGIAADSVGSAFVTGWTVSTNFPNTTNGLALYSFVRTNKTIGIATNSFVARLDWNGSNATLGFARTFGGRGLDTASGIALDTSGNVFIVGSATSTNFPVTAATAIGSLRATNSGAADAFVTAFKFDFSALLWSAYLGGRAKETANAIALNSAGDVFVCGQTLSTNFPVFAARQSKLNGTNDAFLAKILTSSFPQLSSRRSGTNVLVSWPPVGEASPTNLVLQTTTNLLAGNWTNAPQPVIFTNGVYTYSFDPTNAARFFRLNKK